MTTTRKKIPTKSIEWQIVILIFIITVINYFDRGALAYAITPIQKAFHIDNTQFGMISAAFGIGYIIMSFFAGFLVDRFGTIKIWPISVLVWSLAIISMGYCRGFWSFFVLRIILGLAEAVHFPALLKTITEWLQPFWRSRFVSIGLLGVPLASVIGGPFLSFLIHTVSWKIMFMILGLFGLIWIAFWTLSFKKIGKKYHPLSSEKQGDETLLQTGVDLDQKNILKKLFSSRMFVGNCLNYFIFGYTVFFALTWLPGYLQQTFKVNILETGGLVVIPWATSAVFLLLGGYLSDYVWKKTRSIRKSRVYLIGLGMFLSGLMFLGTALSQSLSTDIFLLSLGMGFAFFVNAPIYSINADLFKSKAGTAQGVMTVFFALAGIVAPSVTGYVTQITGNFEAAIYILFILSVFSALISFCFQFETKKSH